MDKQEIMMKSVRYRFIYSMVGLVLGLFCMIGGIGLFLSGIEGASSWTMNILGNESSLTDAAPGLMLFAAGLLVVVITRYRARLDFDTQGPNETKEKYQATYDMFGE